MLRGPQLLGEEAMPRLGSKAATSPGCSPSLSGRMMMTCCVPSSSTSTVVSPASCWIWGRTLGTSSSLLFMVQLKCPRVCIKEAVLLCQILTDNVGDPWSNVASHDIPSSH
ncbi:hypothetical protein E2C01_003293 [Portunus trituberculatus]|uniref:Uncharacterized protein n=1 Tax=Portunus trituberculatus TaxID=210409 RepID=A0A5B7CPU1_PORTR|nr:hypothetical protein [Portunus trituberculatus]